jgi:hypothetical protein
MYTKYSVYPIVYNWSKIHAMYVTGQIQAEYTIVQAIHRPHKEATNRPALYRAYTERIQATWSEYTVNTQLIYGAHAGHKHAIDSEYTLMYGMYTGHIYRPYTGHIYRPYIPAIYTGHRAAIYTGHVPAIYTGHVPAIYTGHIPAIYTGHIAAIYTGHIPAIYTGHIPAI